MRRFRALAFGAVVAVLSMTCRREPVASSSTNSTETSKSTPAQQPLTIGIVTWVGYGPFFVGLEKGFFAEEGVDLRIKVLDGAGEREAAYQAGALDLFPNTPDAFVIFATQQRGGKIIMPLDESRGADGVIAKRSIENIAGLKGHTVGFQNGITSHFFLLYLLKEAGVKARDIKQRNLGAGEAGAAFAAGQLDAAVTWEPWLTRAKTMPNAHVLATSADTPGLLADVLMVSDNVIQTRSDVITRFVRGWYRSTGFMRENPSAAAVIVAKALRLQPEEATAMLTTTHFFTPDEARAYMGHRAAPGLQADEVFDKAAEVYFENGVIQTKPDTTGMIESRFMSEYR